MSTYPSYKAFPLLFQGQLVGLVLYFLLEQDDNGEDNIKERCIEGNGILILSLCLAAGDKICK